MAENDRQLQSYYRLHAHVYDATRWSFLFGRERLMRRLAESGQHSNILEIGCGTGANLAMLARLFPEASLTGVDLSAVMLEKAWKKLRSQAGRVKLIHSAYARPLHGSEPAFDLIVCSYALTMFNPGWEQAISSAAQDLAPDGRFALVDFHDSGLAAFKRWMGLNHVRMDGHLRPVLEQRFHPEVDEVHHAYSGLWQYVTFIGRPRSAPL